MLCCGAPVAAVTGSVPALQIVLLLLPSAAAEKLQEQKRLSAGLTGASFCCSCSLCAVLLQLAALACYALLVLSLLVLWEACRLHCCARFAYPPTC